MDILILLIPIALGLGALGLAAFMWALRSGQFEDPEGAANRFLFVDEAPVPAPERTATAPNRDEPAGSWDSETIPLTPAHATENNHPESPL